MGYVISNDGDIDSRFIKVSGEKLNAQRISLLLQLERGSWPSEESRGIPLTEIRSGRYTIDEIKQLVETEASKIANVQNVNISRIGNNLGIMVKHGDH